MKNIAHAVGDELLKSVIIHSEKFKLVGEVAQFFFFQVGKGRKAFHQLVENEFKHRLILLQRYKAYLCPYPHYLVLNKRGSLNLV